MSTFVNKGRAWPRIVLAAAVSTALHAGLLAVTGLQTPAAPEDLPPLEVRVVTVEPAAASPARSVARAAPVVRSSPPIAKRAAASSAPQVNAGADVPPSSEEPIAAEETVVETPTTPIEESIVTATAPTSTFSPEPPALPAFPRSGRITYDLVYGNPGFPVARTVQSWKIDGTRYQLASRSETTGLVDLFRSQHWTYLSRGELTSRGFRPEVFLMSRERGRGRGIEQGRAQFHWARGTVTVGNAARSHEESLPEGSQDRVSFIYQLAIDPPSPGRKQVAITNGTRLQTYVVDVLPEERIETPLGVLRALPVTQVRRPGSESVDVWLAVEYRHLPVRMRFYSRDGEPAGEQIVTEIRLGDD